MYADDLVIGVRSMTGVRRCLRVIREAEDELGLKMNVRKSGILNMNWRRKDDWEGVVVDGVKVIE